ncbi:MAG: ribulokinase [Ruminococcaceae bacterium]|nr:ribulokinase [Oscillospiraceae bacterium]
MSKYTIGIDYGTLSGRAVLVDIANGAEIATEVLEYKHGVMDKVLYNSDIKLPRDYALQHPHDYIDVLEHCVPEIIKRSGVHKSDIIGIGIDFTSCTLIPVYSDGTPLCFDERFSSLPCSYVKLWKDHSSVEEAALLTNHARSKGMAFIERYGGNISPEWLVPKVMHILNNAPEVYNSADYFIEAADWIVWQLTGKQVRSSCTSGYKALWHSDDGYPDPLFFEELDVRLKNLVQEKLNAPVQSIGTKAGSLTKEMAQRLGLQEGTAVAVGNIDGHCTVPAAKVTKPGEMLLILGTSACFMTLDERELDVKEIAGYVKDGMIPGYFGYEAGQACMGDHFAWYLENMLPYSYKKKADELGISEMQYIFDLASRLEPGENHLIALDWWNGNRALEGGADLSGTIVGMDLSTKPEDIFRALVEATAYGARMIIENFRKYGLNIDIIHAAGGIAEKNPFVMQLYCDVIGCDIKVSGSPQAAALGAAIFGAVAAGKGSGGYDTVAQAAQKMGKLKDVVYKPDLKNKLIYDKLYDEFCTLFDYFGRGKNKIMKNIKNIKE